MEFVKVTGMRESELNLGKFGTPGRKPLLATTNHLEGLSPRSMSEEGTKDQSFLGWPKALNLKIAKAVREGSFEDQHVVFGGSMKAMTPEKWKEHVRSGHYPARRDCLQCVMHGATGHRHARVEHPSLLCLTVDITGPFRTQGEDPGARGDRAKAAKMKYLLVAKFTIPESYVTGEFKPTRSEPLDEEVGPKDLFDEEDKVSGGDDEHTGGSGGDDRDPGEAIVEGEPLDAEEDSEEADTGTGVGFIVIVQLNLQLDHLFNGYINRLYERWSEGLYLGLSDQEHQPDEDQEMSVLEDGQDPPARRLRIHGKSAPRIAAIGGNPDDVGDSSGRGHSPDLEHHVGGPKGRGRSPDYRDSSNGIEDEEVVLSPRVAVRDGKLVLEQYDDDLPSDQEDICIRSQGIGEARGDRGNRSPRVAVLEHNPDHELDEDDPRADQEKIRDPEVYAQLVLKQGWKVDESVVEYLFELLPDYPLATKVVNLFIQEKLGEHACWSTFSMHRNLNVKKHRDSHNARDKASYLIPISDFKDGGLWVQLKTGEEVKEEDVVILDGDRGLVKSFQSEEGNKQVIPFDPRRRHATRQWSGNRLVLAVYNVRGLEKINSFDKEIVEEMREVKYKNLNRWKLSWNLGHGPDHFIEGMAERWEQIKVEEPRLILVDDQGEELHLGRMLGMSTIRAHNAVMNVEEVIVLWIHRKMDFRGGIPRLAMMCARDVNDLMKFVEVAEGETSEEYDVRMMKAAPENIYTPNIEDIVSKVSPESPLKVTHTVDPREVLPVVDVRVPAMEAELAALDKMAAIKRCKGPEAQRMRKDPNVVIVPSKLVFTVKPGLEPGKIRRKVRCVACGNFSGESAEELGDVYSAGATIDLESIVGYILFYVDDTLAVGPPEYVRGFFDWLEATWETSGREVVSKDTT
ncbi:GIP, partial [Symbiodinium sp. KB8]